MRLRWNLDSKGFPWNLFIFFSYHYALNAPERLLAYFLWNPLKQSGRIIWTTLPTLTFFEAALNSSSINVLLINYRRSFEQKELIISGMPTPDSGETRRFSHSDGNYFYGGCSEVLPSFMPIKEIPFLRSRVWRLLITHFRVANQRMKGLSAKSHNSNMASIVETHNDFCIDIYSLLLCSIIIQYGRGEKSMGETEVIDFSVNNKKILLALIVNFSAQ